MTSRRLPALQQPAIDHHLDRTHGHPEHACHLQCGAVFLLQVGGCGGADGLHIVDSPAIHDAPPLCPLDAKGLRKIVSLVQDKAYEMTTIAGREIIWG
jgi:hypothetical protein